MSLGQPCTLLSFGHGKETLGRFVDGPGEDEAEHDQEGSQEDEWDRQTVSGDKVVDVEAFDPGRVFREAEMLALPALGSQEERIDSVEEIDDVDLALFVETCPASLEGRTDFLPLLSIRLAAWLSLSLIFAMSLF